MASKLDSQLLYLRLIIAYLGEKNQYGWWQSSVLSPLQLKVLANNFPRTNLVAGLSATSEVARRTHDDKLGVGRVFHLFRLPFELEQSLHKILLHEDSGVAVPASKEEGLEQLREFVKEPIEISPGPIQIGRRRTIRSPFGIQEIAKHYLSAFQSGIQCFPYFADE